MASNLACVGLAVEDVDDLRRLVSDEADGLVHLGTVDGVVVLRWQDAGGARLVVDLRGGELLDLLPSFAGEPGALLRDVVPVNDDVATAAVVDEAGEQLTALCLELEERRLLPVAGLPDPAAASVVALGVQVSVHADEAAFSDSDDSLLSPPGEQSDPPDRYVEQGWPWPPRMAAESFVSYGVWTDPQQAEAYARLCGTVLAAEQRTTVATGQGFVVARVRTVGMEVDVCLAASEHAVPAVGSVVTGEVLLVGSLPVPPAHAPVTPRRRRWLGRRS